MSKFIIILCVFLCAGCGMPNLMDDAIVNSCSFRVDRGFVVKWNTLPIPVYLHESTANITRKNFLAAIDMWNESWNYHSGKGALFELIGEVQMDYVPSKDPKGDEINILYIDNKHKFLSSKQQGVTHVRNSFGGSIREGDITINNIDYLYFYEPGSFDYSVYTNVPKLSTARFLASSSPKSFWQNFLYALKPLWNMLTFWKKQDTRTPAARKVPISKREVDFISLSIHELGHLAGMAHIEGQESVMNPQLSRGQIRRNINELELNKLSCVY